MNPLYQSKNLSETASTVTEDNRAITNTENSQASITTEDNQASKNSAQSQPSLQAAKPDKPLQLSFEGRQIPTKKFVRLLLDAGFHESSKPNGVSHKFVRRPQDGEGKLHVDLHEDHERVVTKGILRRINDDLDRRHRAHKAGNSWKGRPKGRRDNVARKMVICVPVKVSSSLGLLTKRKGGARKTWRIDGRHGKASV